MSISDPIQLGKTSKIIFTSFSKRNFYERAAISATILKAGHTPLSPFMNFDYNLGGIVPKDLIRVANNTLIERCDELWVFDEISDGVLVEVFLAQKYNKPVRFLNRVLGDEQDFAFITEDQVRLEDVSPWMWDWIRSGKDLSRWHPRLRFHKTYPIVYPAYSKRNFYLQMHISQFCLEHKMIPLNPFMLFRYFLGDSVPRAEVYRANADIVRLCDELWAFDAISDGVLDEIALKRKLGGKVRFYRIESTSPVVFRKISAKGATFEESTLEKRRGELA